MEVLLLLAHADDETLGAGGWVPQLIEAGHTVSLITVSNGVVDQREASDDNRSALASACSMLGILRQVSLGFDDQQFDRYPIVDIIRSASQQIPVPPDLIITHASTDLNRDHQVVHEAAKVIGRPRGKAVSILGCEIPCGSQWSARPFPANFYVPLTSAQLTRKIEVFGIYTSEIKQWPDPFSEQGLRTLAQQRGMESGHEAAEAFEVIRWNWTI